MLNSIERFYNSKYLNPLLFIIFLVIPFVFYWDYFVNGYLIISGDGLQMFSFRVFLNNSLSQGEFPLWNRYLANGVPFAADMTNAALHPLRWMISFLPIREYVFVYYALHLAIGSFFFYLYLKEIGCNKTVAISTALIYLLSVHLGGLRKSHMMIIATIIYFPMILFFIEKYFKTNKRRWAFGVIIAMALQFYSVFIQAAAYSAIVAFFYALILAIHYRNEIKISKLLIDGTICGVAYVGLIAAQLLPTLHLLATYIGRGSVASINIDFFQSFSTHPINLISMVFPRFWGYHNTHQPLAPFAFSEMDIELFLGILLLSFVIYGMLYLHSKMRVRLAMAIMVITFIFSSNAHIPILSRVLFMIPIINGFRVPSRILFIFIFFAYVIFALVLSELSKEGEVEKYLNFVKKYGLLLVGVIVVFTFPSLSNLSRQEDINFYEFSEVYNHFRVAFLPILFVALLLICASIFYPYITTIKDKIPTKFTRYTYGMVCALITMVTIIETHPFTVQTHPTRIENIFEDEALQAMQPNIGFGNALLASTNHGTLHPVISMNGGMYAGIPTINALLAFNNPNLFRLFSRGPTIQMNYGGILFMLPDIHNVLFTRNDLISMLGVRYVIDPEHFITDTGGIKIQTELGDLFYSVDSIPIIDMVDQIFVYAKQVHPNPNTYYEVKFDVETHTVPDLLWINFYDGGDSEIRQLRVFDVEPGHTTLTARINSGNYIADRPLFFRIVSIPTSDIYITNLTIREVEHITQYHVYVPLLVNDRVRIFENTNAQDILFAPMYTRNIPDRESIINNPHNYHLVNGSYIEGFRDMDLGSVNTSVEVLNFNSRGITANVTTDASGFINFTQNYFPGWRGYVNGQRVPVYMVNALIMGMEVPAGQSHIEFRFTSPMLILGAFITGITLLAICFLVYKEVYKERKYENLSIR